MKILFLPSWYPNKYDENSGIFIKKHIKLVAENNEVSVLYIHADSKKGNWHPELEVIRKGNFTEYKFYYRKSNFLTDTLNHLGCLIRGYKKILKETGKPQICHLFVAYPAGLGALYLKKVHNLNYVITEHWTGFTKFDNRFVQFPELVKKFVISVFKNALAVSAISKYLAEELASNNIVTQLPFIIYNKLEFGNFLKAFTPGNSKITAVTVSNLDNSHKNIVGLIDAVAEVVNHHPGFILNIVGDGTDKNHLIDHAKRLNLHDKNIFFIGYVPNKDIIKYYLEADFFVLNSNFETFSIATAEAIAYGLPVVVTKCGGPEEFVNEKNGILVESKNTRALSDALIKMYETFKNYDTKAISEDIRVKYSDKTVEQQLKDFYKIALSKLKS